MQNGLTFHFDAVIRHHLAGKMNHHFAAVPDDAAEMIKDLVPAVDAPWGMINAWVTVLDHEWKTILFPRKGGTGYDISINKKLRKRFNAVAGDTISITLFVPV